MISDYPATTAAVLVIVLVGLTWWHRSWQVENADDGFDEWDYDSIG